MVCTFWQIEKISICSDSGHPTGRPLGTTETIRTLRALWTAAGLGTITKRSDGMGYENFNIFGCAAYFFVFGPSLLPVAGFSAIDRRRGAIWRLQLQMGNQRLFIAPGIKRAEKRKQEKEG